MRILVVEDHADTRNVLTGLLTRWGYIVSAADSLQSGLERLNTEPPVDVIVSDIALPDGTGYALVSEARRRGKRVLAIALSGYAYPSDVRIAKLTGFDHTCRNRAIAIICAHFFRNARNGTKALSA